MPVTLAIDFGSTFTKVVALDEAGGRLIGVAQAPTTVEAGITLGLQRALSRLEESAGVKRRDIGDRVAASSAAGGLRMVAVGLVPDLTAEAARRAALGAGAKVLRVFSYELSRRDLEELGRLAPDMLLLAGGTDGGEAKTIVRNAAALASLRLPAPIVVAGNRAAQDEVEATLTAAGLDVTVVDNVLPELGELNVEPARAAIRGLFMDRITRAKGLERAEAFVGRIVMPTPMAVLEGARLLADGSGRDDGLGELVVVDVGGATTDVHSIATGAPTTPGLVARGLPEPYAKRTVEGDLGIRVNARTILDTAGMERLVGALGRRLTAEEVEARVDRLTREVDHLPADDGAHDLDAALATLAVDVALDRHAGRVSTVYTPLGPAHLVHGKDLSMVGTVLGTGGVLAHGRCPGRVLGAARATAAAPASLRPRAPALLVDRRYMLFAAGLLAAIAPRAAVAIMREHLTMAEGGDDGA